MNWDEYDAVLFDLDGVITPTAEVHMRAWRLLFEGFLAEQSADLEPYRDDDYFTHIDGKPRYDGVAAFLASRGLELPYGSPEDPADRASVCGLGNRKNEAFRTVLEQEGVQAYPGSLALLEDLQRRGTPMAIVSSSRNAPQVLEAAGVSDFFPVVMHGALAAERGIAGKPAPDTFVAAAVDLGVEPARCVVLEDAVSGVAAGAAGGFALVIGVDRGTGEAALRQAGADLVVQDLEELL